MSVCIVGAGVIGLSTALRLLETRPDIRTITIVSEQFPQDQPINHTFTSPWAGAHFRPFPHRDSDYASDKRESEYTRETYNYFKGKSKQWLSEATVEFMKGIDWLENPSIEYQRLGAGYNESSLEKFLQQDSNLPAGVTFGCSYETWCLNAPLYLLFLYDQVMKKSEQQNVNIRVKRIKLEKLKDICELYPDVNVVVNASGCGLQWEGGLDPKCFLVRGQTLLLDVGDKHDTIPYAHATITHQAKSGDWTFVIKRPGKNGKKAYYILGGTKQPGDYSVMPRDTDTEKLIGRGKKLFPELLENFEIKNVNVGFRPLRVGGSRVELEFNSSPDGEQLPVIHAYGLGGMGFETSMGVAYHIQKLYNNVFSTSKL
ncbi:hypothetical protein KDRO_D03210 [Kluyveromyces lactis]|nr:hypothetical protein KDRO_D03210 [Kluyveromyces lactis]